MEEIILEVWGDFACFSNPAGGKVERLSYPFPTPSAARGILSAVYSKPAEFFWQVNRIAASIVPRETFSGTADQLCRQALRRIRNGKAFMQPSLGLREFVAYFEESDGTRKPIPADMDAGLMVYDVFDLHDYEVRKKTRPQLSLFHAVMKQGVIQVPPYDSPEVLKGGSLC